MKKFKEPEMEIITLDQMISTVGVVSGDETETDWNQWGPLEQEKY